MIIHDCLQRSPEWYAARCGIPTASRFSSLLTPKTLKPAKSAYAFELAYEKITGNAADDWPGNEDTERGIESEGLAKDAYEFLTGNTCSGIGFVTNDEATAGCSPDMLVGDDGLLEIKAPRGPKAVQLYCEYVLAGHAIPAEYHLQIQGQLMICEKKWCDLVIFHQDLEPKIIRVLPDQEIHRLLREQITVILADRDKCVDIMRDQ